MMAVFVKMLEKILPMVFARHGDLGEHACEIGVEDMGKPEALANLLVSMPARILGKTWSKGFVRMLVEWWVEKTVMFRRRFWR